MPKSLQYCTKLVALDLGLNHFTGSIPTCIKINLQNLIVLGLRWNKFNGHIPLELCQLSALQIIDFADNNLSGNIPSCFNNFEAMSTRHELNMPMFYSS